MNVEPRNFDRDALVSTLLAWELSVTSLSYLPVGAGAHHYLAVDSGGQRWFVTVDGLFGKLFAMLGPTFSPWIDVDLEAAFKALERAFRTAVALRDGGLEFVHAPITTPDGDVLRRLDDDYAVSVFPFIDRISDLHGPDGRRRLLETLGRLHAAGDTVPSGIPQRDTLTVPHKHRLLTALHDLRSPWTSGPYGEPARVVFRAKAPMILDMFERCDELADAVRAADNPWVVTHGQMHPGNIVRTEDDNLLLVDWDTVVVAPRERDMVWGDEVHLKTDEDWIAYTSAASSPDIDLTAVDLYRHIGALWELCNYSEMFRSRHIDDADIRREWADFESRWATADS
jgi:spectinomycin phosphotransferase